MKTGEIPSLLNLIAEKLHPHRKVSKTMRRTPLRSIRPWGVTLCTLNFPSPLGRRNDLVPGRHISVYRCTGITHIQFFKEEGKLFLQFPAQGTQGVLRQLP